MNATANCTARPAPSLFSGGDTIVPHGGVLPEFLPLFSSHGGVVMRSVWQQLLVVLVLLGSTSWHEAHGQSSRWKPLGEGNDFSLWLDTQSLQEIDRTVREAWLEYRYSQARRDSSMFEKNGHYRGENGLGYRYFSVERARHLMRADCARRRITLVDWMQYAPDGSVVHKQLSGAEIEEQSVSPESSGEMMFDALCRRKPMGGRVKSQRPT